MDKIEKFLKKFSQKERSVVEHVIDQVTRRDIVGLDIKKLRGEENLFRVRKGSIRIVFSMKKDHVRILAIERRSDTTY